MNNVSSSVRVGSEMFAEDLASRSTEPTGFGAVAVNSRWTTAVGTKG